MCDEPFCEVISVSLHMSVITQDGESALMMAVGEGRTEVVSLLLKAGANIDLQNNVHKMDSYCVTITWHPGCRLSHVFCVVVCYVILCGIVGFFLSFYIIYHLLASML